MRSFRARLRATAALLTGPITPALSALSLSAATFIIGTAATGTIAGATAGSTISASALPAGLTINGAARTWSWTGSGSAFVGSITLTEALAGRTRDTVIAVAITPAAGTVVTAGLMGQSEMVYEIDPAIAYRGIPQPTPGNGNLVLVTQSTNGAAPVRTVVTPATVAAGQVNPAMAALSALLAYVRPGVTFVLGDLCVAGTSRYGLANDTTDGTDGRSWGDFTSVVTAIESEFGSVQHLIECWYNADAAWITSFKSSFWPIYFGANADGSPFTLGGTVNGQQIDHCIYDASAAPGSKGRGVFARSATKWHMLTPMPFFGAPDSSQGGTEMDNFSANNSRLTEPARSIVRDLPNDALAASTGLVVGPSAHITKFGGASTIIHPDTANKDGQILLAWPIAIALLRAAGVTIGEPEIVDVECAADGSWADLVVTLPNGGTLKTLAGHRNTAYTGAAPHQQAVTGVELSRSGGSRRPVFRPDQESYPASHRGTVQITDPGSGTGAARRGRVRITPTSPFVYGDSLSYLRGQGTAALLLARDMDLYPWMLIEHVPAFYDASAMYPMEGIAVRPSQTDRAIPLAAPAFAGRGAAFDGGDYFTSNAIAQPATANGLLSVWIRNAQATWNSPTGSTVLQFRLGSTAVLELLTTTVGRMQLRLANDTATDIVSFYAAGSSTQFALNTWYHIMAAWTAAGVAIYVNGQQVATLAFSAIDMAGQPLTRVGIGAWSTGGSPWVGDIGHLYLNLAETLDLTVAANRQRFAAGGQPADLGPQGALPTGQRPAYYYDGAAPGWSNRGSAGDITQTGALTASAPAPSYVPA